MSLVVIAFLFGLAYLFLAKIESPVQFWIGAALAVAGVLLTVFSIFQRNPNWEKLEELKDDAEFYEKKAKSSKKKRKEILEQAELAKQEGQSRRDGDEVVTVVKYGDEYKEERRPLKRFER